MVHVGSDRRPRRSACRDPTVGPSLNKASRSRSMSRCCVMPVDLLPDRGSRVRLEGGPHGAMGVIQSGTGRAGAGCRGSRRSPTGRTRGSGAGRGSPAVPAAAVGTRDRAGPGRPTLRQLVGRGRSVDRQHPQVRRPAALARRLGDADVDHEALEPRIESVRIAEALQVAPGDHQRVLEGILGPIDVAEDPLGDREEPVAPSADQVDVRLPIPVPGRLHEVAIHGSRLLDGRPWWAASDCYWSSVTPHRSFFALTTAAA